MEFLSPKFIQTFFTEISMHNLEFDDAIKMNQKEAENLLSVQNFINYNGTFMVRLDVNEEENITNLMLSFVYEGRILHHKIILMLNFYKQFCYSLENGGISFPSVASLIKYHASKKVLPLPCILKQFGHSRSFEAALEAKFIPKKHWSDFCSEPLYPTKAMDTSTRKPNCHSEIPPEASAACVPPQCHKKVRRRKGPLITRTTSLEQLSKLKLNL